MKSLLLICCFALINSALSEDVVLRTTRSSFNEDVFDFTTSIERLKNIPQWDGVSEGIPFSMTDAVVAARKEANTDHPNNVGELRHVSFIKCVLPGNASVWSYSITFRQKKDYDLQGHGYVVLLDGSVISPSQRK